MLIHNSYATKDKRTHKRESLFMCRVMREYLFYDTDDSEDKMRVNRQTSERGRQTNFHAIKQTPFFTAL